MINVDLHVWILNDSRRESEPDLIDVWNLWQTIITLHIHLWPVHAHPRRYEMLWTGVQPSHLHPPAKRAWVIFSNNHPKIDFFFIFWTAPTLGALLGEFIFSWWCLLCPRSVLTLNSNASPFSVLHSDIFRAFLCKSKRWHPITCSCIDCCHCRLSGMWGEKYQLWWNCSSMERQAGLCVYVFSSRWHSEDQIAHYICSVRTFWLVLAISRGWDSVSRLRMELG